MSYYHLERILTPSTSNSTVTTADQDDDSNFDPRIFWGVNACFLIAVVVTCCYCYHNRNCITQAHERRRQTDLEFQRNQLERRERKRKAKEISPEKLRRLLLSSFKKHRVMMTVKEGDFVADPEALASDGGETRDDDSFASSSLSNQMLLTLPTGRTVPNCCAICLGEYEVGDQVVWSTRDECGHAFHLPCIIDWFIKMQPAIPCPCCRAEFTDWDAIRREDKIAWTPEFTFNPNFIRLTESTPSSNAVEHEQV